MNIKIATKDQPEEKRQTWFSKIPQKIEELKHTGQLLGISIDDDSFSASPVFQEKEISTKDLLKTFSKKDFRIDQLLKNFYNQFQKSGIHDYLVNRLYGYSEADLNFYMAELCHNKYVYFPKSYLYITRDSEMLRKFLIDMSSRSINLYLLIYWSLDSFSDALKIDETRKEQFDRVQKLLHVVETAFIEGNQQDKLNQSIDFRQQSKEKDQRAKYNNSIKTFIKNMVNISLTLKKHESDERKDKLKMYMKRADKWLQQLREKNPGNDFFQGIFIPFRADNNSQFNSTFIVRIVYDEVTCFNTKMRVPYRVAIETIDINELKQSKKKIATSTDLDDIGSIGDGPEFSEGSFNPTNQQVIQPSESTDKINKYGRNFSIWACEQETKELQLNDILNDYQKSKNKSNLENLLNKDEEQTSVEKFHRLYKKSRSLIPDDAAFRTLKKFQRNFKLQQTQMNEERQQKYEENIKRFNIYFKEKKMNLQRRSSIVTEMNVSNPLRENHQYIVQHKPICKYFASS